MEAHTEQPTPTAIPTGKKGRKPKAAKVAPPALADIPDDTIAHHAEKLIAAQQRLDDVAKEMAGARGHLAGVLDVAKKDGIPKSKLKAYTAAMKRDAQDLRDELEFIDRVARLMGNSNYTEQMELFRDSRASPVKNPRDEGLRAGKGGMSAADNPYAAGTEEHQTWDSAWREGQAAIVAGMAPKGRAKTQTVQ